MIGMRTHFTHHSPQFDAEYTLRRTPAIRESKIVDFSVE